MWKYYDIETLDDAKDSEEICALYPEPIKNISGHKKDEYMKKAEQDKRDGKCRLLVWRSDDTNAGYNLSSNDIEQIKIRYNNAKTMAYEYKKKSSEYTEYIFELGRAFALEGILRMLGYDYTEVATCDDIQWKI